MRRAFALLERAAPTDSCIVLEGETGTGKEALARAIHEKSERAREAPSWWSTCGVEPSR